MQPAESLWNLYIVYAVLKHIDPDRFASHANAGKGCVEWDHWCICTSSFRKILHPAKVFSGFEFRCLLGLTYHSDSPSGTLKVVDIYGTELGRSYYCDTEGAFLYSDKLNQKSAVSCPGTMASCRWTWAR